MLTTLFGIYDLTVIKNFALNLDCIHKRGCDFEKINSEEVSGILIVAGLVLGDSPPPWSSKTLIWRRLCPSVTRVDRKDTPFLRVKSFDFLFLVQAAKQI